LAGPARRLGAGEAHLDWPDGERAGDFLARVRAAWRKVQAVARARDVIVVSHGGPLRVLSGLACGDSSVDGVLGPGAGITLQRGGGLRAKRSWRRAAEIADGEPSLR
jgi:broad specificity phosphatase PhoE